MAAEGNIDPFQSYLGLPVYFCLFGPDKVMHPVSLHDHLASTKYSIVLHN